MNEEKPRRNNDTMRILGVLGLGILVTLIFIGVYYLSASNNTGQYTYVDSTSGEIINTQKTGGDVNTDTDIVGLASVQSELNVDLNVYSKARRKLIDFFTLQYPSSAKVYYRKGTAKLVDGQYVFELQSDKNEKFTVKLSVISDNYAIVVNDSKGEILNYKSDKIAVAEKDIALLPKKLPYRFKIDETDALFSYNNVKQQYILSLNWCGDEELKQRALDDAAIWAEKQGFDLSKIHIEVPLLCDGGAD